MNNPPSVFRSNLLSDIRYRRQPTDPFRALWPDARDFTYVPWTGRLNRSRIHFYLCSDSLLYNVTKCHIGPGVTSNLFDHKPVFLTLGPSAVNPSNKIFNSNIEHPRFNYIVKCVNTYLSHADPVTFDLANQKVLLGNTLSLIRNLRAGHPILFSLFDIRNSDTSKPVFDIDTPILF
jgi:hypothetical protein